jgi:glutathione S-transferase
MSLVLHHLNRSRSERLIWLLEELGVDYELVRHKRDPQVNLAPAELVALHPMGKAPLLVHDGQVIAESGAIALHLLEAFDPDYRLHPAPGAPNRASFFEWLHGAEGAVFLPFLMNTYLSATGLKDSLLSQYMAGEREKALGAIEARLDASPYFAGDDFSAADIMMGFQLEAAEERGALPKTSPVHDWLERVRAREAHQSMRAITADD